MWHHVAVAAPGYDSSAQGRTPSTRSCAGSWVRGPSVASDGAPRFPKAGTVASGLDSDDEDESCLGSVIKGQLSDAVVSKIADSWLFPARPGMDFSIFGNHDA